MKKYYILSFDESSKPQKMDFPKNASESFKRGLGKDATERVIAKELNNQNLQKHPILAKLGINTKRTYISGLDSMPFGIDKNTGTEIIAKNEQKAKLNSGLNFNEDEKELGKLKESEKINKEKLQEIKKKLSNEAKIALIAGASGAATGAVSDTIRGTANLGAKTALKSAKRIIRLVKI